MTACSGGEKETTSESADSGQLSSDGLENIGHGENTDEATEFGYYKSDVTQTVVQGGKRNLTQL